MDRNLLEYRPEIDAFSRPAVTAASEPEASTVNELQQAAELLERVDEGELEGYLLELIETDNTGPGRPVANALAGILERAARRLLRRAGAPPNAAASRVFGLELEGLSAEDQAFEVARHFIRFAVEAARRAGHAAGTGTPQSVARHAASMAARTLAPGLLPAQTGSNGATGLWFRRGRQLIVLDP